MINTIAVQTAQGIINMPVMHKNGALQVIQKPSCAEGIYIYNTVHNNGLQLPLTDTGIVEDAIKICDWIAEYYPEFTKVDLDISRVPKSRTEEYKTRLHDFRLLNCEWQDD